MENWTIHWLEAAGDLSGQRGAIREAVRTAHDLLAARMDPPRLDITVQRLRGQTIPETGDAGFAVRDSLFTMTIDPENPNFAANLAEGGLVRTVLHEVNHCLRMGGPGYGRTLGEALVSEGLAGHFVGWLVGNAPESWERAVDLDALRADPIDAGLLDAPRYDHTAWFFGAADRPRWYGYTLGYRMVGAWLAEAGDPDAAARHGVPAATVIAARARAGLVRRPEAA